MAARKLAVPKGGRLPMWRPGSMRPVFANAPEVVRQTLLDPTAFYQLYCSYEGRPIVLESWQVAFLRRRHRFRALEKSVQIGYSFVCAMEALWMAFVFEDETSAFISINESDAREKILYALKLYDGMDPMLKRFVPVSRDSAEEFWLGPRERPARLITKPATSGLRGLAGHVYLDEVDHYRPGQDTETFTGAMGRVTRNRRRLTLGSSVFGEDTVLSKVMSPDNYPDFLKFRLPWWVSENEEVLENIGAQRRNMPEEDFAQEYECHRGGATDSAFSQDLIRRSWTERESVDEMGLDQDGIYLAGFDPGGSRHPAVLTVLQQEGDTWEQRVQVEMRNVQLRDQEDRLHQLLVALPGLRLAIDSMGLGQQMSENLRTRWGARVKLVTFSEATRSEMTQNLKRLMEDARVRILRDRRLAHELNRTKRAPGGKVVQSGSERSYHFDRFWALAMAAYLVATGKSVYESREMRVIEWAS